MTHLGHALVRSTGLWLLLAGLWSSAGHAVIDATALAYAARWAA